MTANTAALVEQLKQAMGTDEQRRSLYQRMLKASEDLDDASVDEQEETPR
jgi:phosphoenolpyruvate synthase/pyruvate phosphate dikinase